MPSLPVIENTIFFESSDHMTCEIFAPGGVCIRVSVALPSGRTISPRANASRHEPLVRGFTRVPASRRYGAPTSLIGGRPLRSVISIFDASGLNEAAGVGGVSRILAMAAGGCL